MTSMVAPTIKEDVAFALSATVLTLGALSLHAVGKIKPQQWPPLGVWATVPEKPSLEVLTGTRRVSKEASG